MIQWLSRLTGGPVALSLEVLGARPDVNFSEVWEPWLYLTLGNKILTIKSENQYCHQFHQK